MQGRLIRARLLENGLTLREFARKHGFKYLDFGHFRVGIARTLPDPTNSVKAL